MDKIYEIEVGAWHMFLDFGQVEKVIPLQSYRETIKELKSRKISFTSYKEKRAADIARFTGIYKGFSKKFIDIMKYKDDQQDKTNPSIIDLREEYTYSAKISVEGEMIILLTALCQELLQKTKDIAYE